MFSYVSLKTKHVNCVTQQYITIKNYNSYWHIPDSNWLSAKIVHQVSLYTCRQGKSRWAIQSFSWHCLSEQTLSIYVDCLILDTSNEPQKYTKLSDNYIKFFFCVHYALGRSEKTKSWKSRNGQADYLPRHSPDVRTVFEIQIRPFVPCEIAPSRFTEIPNFTMGKWPK